jgi:hypothetical protein
MKMARPAPLAARGLCAYACCTRSQNGRTSGSHRGKKYMTEPRLPNHEDTSTGEGRFGQRNARRHSGWSSAGAIIFIVIILGIVFVFAYVAMHTR